MRIQSSIVGLVIALVAAVVAVLSLGPVSVLAQNDGSVTRDVATDEKMPGTHPRDLLGNADYPAFCYGGFRGKTREDEPSVGDVKEDMRILAAMGVKLLRTYNTQQYRHAATLLEAIRQLRDEDPEFEMYVMLGAWIECEGAWTDAINHDDENLEGNRAEIDAAVELANAFPETVKLIAVGNESMVRWATTYFVQPDVVLKWVNHLQELKSAGELPADVWITSSDNYAAWGGDPAYHCDDLRDLIAAVDFISLHTYPFHHTHYDPEVWGVPADEAHRPALEQIQAAVARSRDLAQQQYQATADYVTSLGIECPLHIGETGWASRDHSFYGASGTRAADEYKAGLYYDEIRRWTDQAGISCFYFEVFDEQWKDASDPNGSENHFGLINIQGQAKFVMWDEVDEGLFDGLARGGSPITKTFDGDWDSLLAEVGEIPLLSELGLRVISTVDDQRKLGDPIIEKRLVILHQNWEPEQLDDATYPSVPLKLNAWEGTCAMERASDGIIKISTGTGDWWGCGIEVDGDGMGENLTFFDGGRVHFDMRGDVHTTFDLGIQTGRFADGTQVNCFAQFGPDRAFELSDRWVSYSFRLRNLADGDDFEQADMTNVTSLLFLRGKEHETGQQIELRNIYYSRD